MIHDRTSGLAGEFDAAVGSLPDSVDRAAVERMRLVARVLDESIRIPGTDFRVGIDPVIGVLPVAGDVVTAGLSLYIVLESARLGVSYRTVLRMLANISLDVAGGAIPFVGDVFDAVWKANKRNLELALEDLATTPERPLAKRNEPIEIEIE